MKKSGKILVIAALFVSAIVMTSCSNLMSLFGAKPSGTYTYEFASGSYGSYKYTCTFSGSKYTMEVSISVMGVTTNESDSGTFKVNGDTAKLYNKDKSDYITIETTDSWKTFKLNGMKFTKK